MSFQALLEDDDIRRTITTLTFKKGEVFLKQGYPAEGLYLIEQGRCQLYSQIPGEKEKIPVAIRGKGDFLAEVSFIDKSKMMASTKSLTNVTAHLIPNQILDGLTLINPGKANQLLAPITQLITSRIERSVRNLYKEKLLLPHLRSAEHFYKKPLQKVPSKKALAILEEQRIDSLPILNLIPAHQRQELIKRLSFFKAQKNQYVFNKGDQDGAVYHVLSGALQTFIQARGKTTKLTIIGPGGSSGLIHFINQSQSMINCVVREDAFLLKITREELDAITKEFPLASDKIRLFLLKSIATTFNKFYMHYLQSKSIHHLF